VFGYDPQSIIPPAFLSNSSNSEQQGQRFSGNEYPTTNVWISAWCRRTIVFPAKNIDCVYGLKINMKKTATSCEPECAETSNGGQAEIIRLRARIAELEGENRDVAKRLSAEQTILRTLVDNCPFRVYAKDLDSRIIFCNTNMARSIGLPNEQLIGKTDADFFPESLAELYIADERALFASGQPIIGKEEPTMDPVSGEPWWTLTSKVPLRDQDGAIVGLVGIGLDLTERKRLEQDLKKSNVELLALNNKLTEAQNQLLQSEKMASVGQLAAGVAHEINNPIGFVMSNLGSLKVQVEDLLAIIDAFEKTIPALADNADLLADIETAKTEADFEFLRGDMINLINESLDSVQRAKIIVETLRDFSRVDSTEWHYANLEKGLESTLSVVWNEIKSKAEVVKEYAVLPDIECMASQVNQVFMNLLINAAQAIETHGTITVRTGFDEESVWVEIADTGTGIKPEHLTRIFDPFFTTKPVGKGTGLGLSLAYGIVKRHHGHLTVSSAVNEGTVFHLSLPRVRVSGEEHV